MTRALTSLFAAVLTLFFTAPVSTWAGVRAVDVTTQEIYRPVIRSTADGFHPAGAVLDEKRGVQHIFIYSGHPNGPASVFRVTRTLDTTKLTIALENRQP